MPVTSTGDLFDALARDASRILGTPESEWIEFKGAPYQLDTVKDRWEMPKDVAAMASASGGCIVIGIGTEKALTDGSDVAVEFNLLPPGTCDATQYRDLIKERIYPQVERVSATFHNIENGKGLFVIEVPGQNENNRPFVIHMLDEEGNERRHAMGFPRRDGDGVSWMPAETIQRDLSLARRVGSLPFPTPEVSPAETHNTLSEDELQAAALAVDAGSSPRLSLQGIRVGALEPPPPEVFEKAAQLLADPPSLRSMGFNFHRYEPPSFEGGALESSREDVFALRFHPRGILTAVMPVTDGGLGWALRQRLPADSPLLLNSIPLVERTLEFFRLLDGPLTSIVDGDGWSIRVQAKGLKTADVRLPHLLAGGIPLSIPAGDDARVDDLNDRFRGNGDPEVDAYQALVRFCQVWGANPSTLPCVEDERVVTACVEAL